MEVSMLDFSCNLKTKNHTFEFDAEANLKVDGKDNPHAFSVKEAVDVANVLLNRVKEIKNKNNKPIFTAKSFDEVVKRIKLVEKVRGVLLDIRLCNVGSSWRSNLKEKLEHEINSTIHSLYEGEYDYDETISISQKIVLDYISAKRYFRSISRTDFEELYDPIFNSKAKMEKLCKDLLSFNYEKYGVNTQEIQKEINTTYADCLKKVDAYNFIIKDLSAEEILSASQSKITRRLNTANIGVSYYGISHWLDDYKNHLQENGYSKKKKEKKTALETTLEKFNKNKESLTQEELLRLFKNKIESQAVLKLMNWETIKGIITSDLKCVKDQVFDRWKLSDTGEYLVEVASEKSPIEKDSFELIKTFLKNNKSEKMFDWEYIQKCESFIDTNYLVTYIKDNPLVKEIPKTFYDKRLSGLPIPTLVDLKQEITKEFVSRLNKEDKIEILPRLGSEFLNFKSNSTIFIMSDGEFDEIKDIEFNLGDLVELYQDVPWKEIRDKIQRNSNLRRSAIPLVLKNKDKEIAETLLNEDFSSLKGDNLVSLCNLVQDLNKNIKAFTNNSRTNYYGGNDQVIKKVFNTEKDLVALFESAVMNSNHGLIDSILEVTRTNMATLQSLKNSLKKINPSKFKITEPSLKYLLDSSTKKHLLKIGTEFEKETYYGTDIDYRLESFFKNMNRKDLTEALGDDLSICKERIYLAEYMTDEEKIDCSHDKNFVRKNLEYLPKLVLAKYKDKKLFKDLVGDLRNTKNSRVADRLNKLLTNI